MVGLYSLIAGAAHNEKINFSKHSTQMHLAIARFHIHASILLPHELTNRNLNMLKTNLDIQIPHIPTKSSSPESEYPSSEYPPR